MNSVFLVLSEHFQLHLTYLRDVLDVNADPHAGQRLVGRIKLIQPFKQKLFDTPALSKFEYLYVN